MKTINQPVHTFKGIFYTNESELNKEQHFCFFLQNNLKVFHENVSFPRSKELKALTANIMNIVQKALHTDATGDKKLLCIRQHHY
jgi:hypothetical protein